LRARHFYVPALASVCLTTVLAGCAPDYLTSNTPGRITGRAVTIYLIDSNGDSPSMLRPREVSVDEQPSVEAAIEALTAYDTDHDRLDNLWDDFCSLGADLDDVKVTEDLITVHFNDHAGDLCDLSEDGWQMRRQQLAWTVRTATGSTAPVQVTVGKDNYRPEGKVTANIRYLYNNR
jgi:hypothetical protein